MRRPIRRPSAEQVRHVTGCPKCGVLVDEECLAAVDGGRHKSSGSRDQNHWARVMEAVKVLKWDWNPKPVEEPDYAPSIDDFARGGRFGGGHGWRP